MDWIEVWNAIESVGLVLVAIGVAGILLLGGYFVLLACSAGKIEDPYQ